MMAAVDGGDPKRDRVSSSPRSPPPLRGSAPTTAAFHCDEALGCFMIRLTDKFSGAEIVRSRDPKVLGTLDAVLDVGGVYDPSQDRFDHHQKGFNEVFGHGFNTKLSSAGLLYKAKTWIAKASRYRSSAWKVYNKCPGYNASDSDSEEINEDSK